MNRAPDTPKKVVAALAASGFAPLKRFGQNFLVDPSTLDRIAALAPLAPGVTVLEVGPGLGALTDRLVASGASVVAAEIDRGLVGHLRGIFSGVDNLVVVEGDVLGEKGTIAEGVAAEVSARAAGKDWYVVANLPYNVTSPLLVALMAPPGPPLRAVVMVQREVGDVLLAAPGEESWSTLSIAVQSRWRVARAIEVAASKFHPRPDVESSVMVLDRHDGDAPHPAFLPFVRRLFQARRKSLRGVLSKAFGAERTLAALAAAEIPPEERPDRLDVDRLRRLHLGLDAPSGW